MPNWRLCRIRCLSYKEIIVLWSKKRVILRKKLLRKMKEKANWIKKSKISKRPLKNLKLSCLITEKNLKSFKFNLKLWKLSSLHSQHKLINWMKNINQQKQKCGSGPVLQCQTWSKHLKIEYKVQSSGIVAIETGLWKKTGAWKWKWKGWGLHITIWN